MKNKKMIAGLLLAVGVSSASAAVLITPDGATSSTTVGGTRTIAEAINNSDLSGTGISVTETHLINSDSAGYWLSASTAVGSGTETISFDLGGTYDVDTIHQWVYTRSGATKRGLQTFDIAFSTNNGVSYSTAVTAASLSMGAFTEPAVTALPAQTRTFTEQTGVTNIQFSNLQNFGDTSYFGLSEIKFEGTAVPEPSSVALLGLGGLGLLIRRRR